MAAEKIGSEVVLSAQGSYPMREIVEQVRTEYGWLVSYEDPIFSEAKLIDVADPGWRHEHPHEPGVLVPRTQALSVRFNAPRTGTTNEKNTLEWIVAQANAEQTTMHYGIVQGTGDRYTIYAEDGYQGTSGVAGANILISDTPGVGPASEASKVLEACSQQSPIPFEVGTVNPNALGHISVPLKHEPETCRHGIERLVNAMGQPAVYEIREDTGNRIMVVNIIRSSYRDSSGDCPTGTKLTPAKIEPHK